MSEQETEIFFVPVERGKYHRMVLDSYNLIEVRTELAAAQARADAVVRAYEAFEAGAAELETVFAAIRALAGDAGAVG